MKKYHKNPRRITGKQQGALTDSLDEFGDLAGIVHDLNTDEIIGGNRRGDSFNINHCELEITHSFDEPDEQGTVAHGFVLWRDNRYAYRQVRWTPRQAEQANIQANKLGGTFDFDILANEFDTTDLLDWGFDEWELGIEDDDMNEGGESNRGIAENSRPQTKIDLIWTTGLACCLAVKMGWKYGINSSGGVCRNTDFNDAHQVVFVDNDFKKYDHEVHTGTVEKYRPKYATVRDVMTREQCEKAEIDYYELAQILDWAEELNESAENVIIIPKFDCLDKIPGKFMLGYSVPTSYGGTPMEIELFEGRRVHLLGGNPDNQIACYLKIPQSVVSLDANQIALKAEFGNTWNPSGFRTLQNIDGLSNILPGYGLYPSIVLSLACLSSWFSME